MKTLIKNANKKGLVDFFNQNFKKLSGSPFTYWDIHGYIRINRFPNYLPIKMAIEEVKLPGCSVKLYNVFQV